MAARKPKYYLVEASVLPEIFVKVMEAKELLETGEVQTVGQAVARVDISRSAFYKYKDSVRAFQDMRQSALVTFSMELKDKPGVLSEVLAIFAGNGANILTINQSIPSSGVAPVAITADTEHMRVTMDAFLTALRATRGVVKVHVSPFHFPHGNRTRREGLPLPAVPSSEKKLWRRICATADSPPFLFLTVIRAASASPRPRTAGCTAGSNSRALP